MKTLTGKHDAGFHQFFIELAHGGQDFPAGHYTGFAFLSALTITMTRIAVSPGDK